MAKLLLSVSEAAAATGLGVWEIRGAVSRGEIPSRKFGRNIKIPAWWVEQLRSEGQAAAVAA